MILLQVLGTLFLFFAISRVLLRWHDQSLSTRELVFWCLVFAGILIVLLFPDLTVKVAHLLGITRGTDVVVYGSVVLLFYLVFRIYVRLENIQHQMILLFRALALIQSTELDPAEKGNPHKVEILDEEDGIWRDS
jgi:hypothetical protein